MVCFFLDERADFFAVLNAKLGEEFTLVSVDDSALANRERLAGGNVLIVGLPEPDNAEYQQHLAMIKDAAWNAGGLPVVVFLPRSDQQGIRDAIAAGAHDYFAETNSVEELRIVLRRAARYYDLARERDHLKQNVREQMGFGNMISADPTMAALFSLACKVSPTDATVLITGETGTGKELLARAIHQASDRSGEPFIAVACSSLPETLIEAELFGHEKGAFTGAVSMRRGRLEAAQRGTIFFDEIGELSPGLQVKLLRVLQERVFERVGSNQSRPMEARIIGATHRDLKQLVRESSFRSDLYYRLNTIELHLPPLRERGDDAVLLTHLFLQKTCEERRRPLPRLAPAVTGALKRYSWPGNVRELQHVIERALVISDGPEIRLQDLPAEVARVGGDEFLDARSFDFEVRTFKRRLIERLLKETGNNKTQVARVLNISRSSLHRLIEELKVAA